MPGRFTWAHSPVTNSQPLSPVHSSFHRVLVWRSSRQEGSLASSESQDVCGGPISTTWLCNTEPMGCLFAGGVQLCAKGSSPTMGSGQPKVFKPFFNNSPVARLGVRPSPTKVFQTSARCCTLLEKVEEKEEGGWWFGGFGALWFGGRGLVGGCGLVTGLGGWGLVVVVWWLGFGASKRLTPNGYNMQRKHAPKHDNDKHTNCSTTLFTTARRNIRRRNK